MFWFLTALAMILTGCAEAPESEFKVTSLPQKELTPYAAATSTQTPLPVAEIQPTPLPSPTPTPRVHIVKAGEDLGGISYLYKVSLQSLLELNPEVDPRLLSVGTQLIIPPSLEQSTEEAILPAPTGVELGDVFCQNVWCFVVATSGDQSVENVSAVIRIKLKDDEEVRSGMATSLVDRLPANSSLPLMVRFPFPVTASYQVSAELSSALPIVDEIERYLDIRVRDVEVAISPDGYSADVKGVVVNRDEKNAGLVRVVLVARDENGGVVGVRIWESDGGLEAEQRLAFQAMVYPVGGKINDVSVFAEAKP